jgi:hypothetical protein
MNTRLLAIILTLCGLGAAPHTEAKAHDLLLVCKGYTYPPSGAIWHSIVTHDAAAEVDGKPCLLSENATEFTLKGPIPANDAIIWIDRLTGQYSITSFNGVPEEYSGGYRGPNNWIDTGTDEGCRQKSRKF